MNKDTKNVQEPIGKFWKIRVFMWHWDGGGGGGGNDDTREIKKIHGMIILLH